ncbi:MAG: hypothetical protein PWR07_1358 [Bacillota bacterium]|nr:hypothetical protein [Bacillota bacterium]
MFPLIPQAPCGSGLGPFCRCLKLGTAGGTSFLPRLPAGQKTATVAANVGAIVPLRRSCQAAAPSRRAPRLPRGTPGAVPHLLRACGAAQPAWRCSARPVTLSSPRAPRPASSAARLACSAARLELSQLDFSAGLHNPARAGYGWACGLVGAETGLGAEGT